MQDTILKLVSGDSLAEQDAYALFSALLAGTMDDAQIGAILALIASRGPTGDELVGAARVMREHVTPVRVELEAGDVLIDTCGTGGTPKSFNVSTVAAIIAAATETTPDRPRVRVAKHGNRSRTGRGSAEVLAALGVHVDASPEVQARCIRDAGVCFSFAIYHHPAMKHAIGPRRSLGFPTIFNLLGPLTNPAGAKRQMIGVYKPDAVDLVAGALVRLGAERAAVLHSSEGLDEVSLAGTTRVAWVNASRISVDEIDPRTLGLSPVPASELVASSVDDAARIARSILSGEPGPHADIAHLNAAVALKVAGVTDDLAHALSIARDSTASGRAARVLDLLRTLSVDEAPAA